MPETIEMPVDVKHLRLIYAINYLKSVVLKGKHVAGQPQSGALFRVIEPLFVKEPFTARMWEMWFLYGGKTLPQSGTAAALDEIYARVVAPDRPEDQRSLVANGFFSKLVRDGLLGQMTKRFKSKEVLSVLRQRAADYEPLSPIHLHFDALDVASWSGDFQEVPWEDVVRVGAMRVLDLLAQRWSPRYGRAYAGFTSDFRLQWDAADSQERIEIREAEKMFIPDLFEKRMAAGAFPDWSRVGCDDDIAPVHIYKLLFALAADPDFLVADRFDAWFLDFATASLAMHALAWADRYTTMGAHLADELLFWKAFYRIFFGTDPLDTDGWGITPAMKCIRAYWSESSLECFSRARAAYHEMLAVSGISSMQIVHCLDRVRADYPLIYVGNA